MSLRDVIGGRQMQIAFPRHLVATVLPLMKAEVAEFEAVFGAPVRFVSNPPATGPRWIVVEDPTIRVNTLRWDSDTTTLTSYVRDAAGLGATLQMLHSLVTLDVDKIDDASSDDLLAAIARLGIEAQRGFPGFDIRDLDWSKIRSSFPEDDAMTLPDFERMIARLQDGHTAVRSVLPTYNPPYSVELVDGDARLRRVPAWSQAAQAGIETGWRLELDDVADWLARTGAPPHGHGLVAGRRAIAITGVTERRFVAIGPTGDRRVWVEKALPLSLDQLISVEGVANDVVYARLQNWIPSVGIEERFDHLMRDHSHRGTLVLDLRGNTGGNLLMAQQLRRRFLRERTLLGTIQFTQGDGTLADPVELWDEPPEEGSWPGDLIVLTDGLTYSASEDFLHGLQGLPHVTVIGAPSGGGSGRPRTLPLIPGRNVSISTALTFDRTGHCIEGQGVQVDIAADPYTEGWRAHLNIASA